jgi:hypothetical protein
MEKVNYNESAAENQKATYRIYQAGLFGRENQPESASWSGKLLW